MLIQILISIILLVSEVAALNVNLGDYKSNNDLSNDRNGYIARRNKRLDCDDDQLMVMLANIQIVNPESIVNLAFEKLTTVCEKLKSNLKTIKDYLKSCHPTAQEDLYYSLVKGVMKLNKALCKEGSLRKDYQAVSDCIQKQDFTPCKGAPDWNENSNKNTICKSYNKIMSCYNEKASASCGKNGGAALTNLMKEVLGGVLPLHCPTINDDADFYEENSIVEKFRTTKTCE